MKVCKFGGSSLAKAENLKKVKEIVEADPARRVIVVSAPGKRFSEDSKVTDLLYITHAHLKYKVGFDEIWEDIAGRYLAMSAECGLSGKIADALKEVRESLTRSTPVDEIVSRGEYLNARLVAEYLGFDFVDASRWMFFTSDGRVDFEKTYAALKELSAVHKKMVLPGFYGITADGDIRTFSRGGSDITGSIAAAALGAEMYENWTDVDGILMADPRIVDHPSPIKEVTFAELRDLSYMGAEVLHPEAVFPVRQAGIPLVIKNTTDMHAPGTLIMESFPEEEEESVRFITGITGRKHFALVSLEKSHLSEDLSFQRKALSVFEGARIPVEHTYTSADCIAFLVASETLGKNRARVLSELLSETDADNVTVSEGISLVALVGRRMATPSGISGKILSALGKKNIAVRTIEYGSDAINIIIGVSDGDFEETIRTLYDSFANH